MHFARALGELGFFRKDPDDEGILPELPRRLGICFSLERELVNTLNSEKVMVSKQCLYTYI